MRRRKGVQAIGVYNFSVKKGLHVAEAHTNNLEVFPNKQTYLSNPQSGMREKLSVRTPNDIYL